MLCLDCRIVTLALSLGHNIPSLDLSELERLQAELEQSIALQTRALKACHLSKEHKIRQCIELPEALTEGLKCPLTLKNFLEPVLAADGVTYERAAIERTLAQT